MEPVVVRQRLAWPLWGFLALLGVGLPALALHPDVPPEARIALLAAGGLTLLALVVLDYVTIVVTDREILGGYRGFVRSRTRLADVTDAREVRVRGWIHGMGLHFNFAGEWCFVARLGRGVRVERRSGRPVVFSCEDPQTVLAAMKRAGAPVATEVS